MKTVDYLELLREKIGITSYYGISKYIKQNHGVGSANTFAGYDKGDHFLSDEMVIIFAQELDFPREVIASDIQAERAKNPEIKKMWAQVARSLQQATAAAFVCVMLSIPTPSAEASTLNGLNFSTLHSIYYANLKKYLKKCLFRLFYFKNWGKCAGFLCV